MSAPHTAMAVLIEPAPYIVRLLEELQAQWTEPVQGWFISASFTQDWRQDGDKPIYGILPRSKGRALRKLWLEMRLTRPSVVFVSGWSHPLIIATIVMARLSGAKVVSMSDTWTSTSRGMRAMFKRLVLRLIHAFTPGGARQARYLRTQCVPPGQIFPACMTSDMRAIHAFMATEGPDRRAVLRTEMGVTDDTVVFLFVGRLEPVKGLDLLIEAIGTESGAEMARLVIVGDGTERNMVVAAAGRDPRLIYRGRLEGEALWAEFAAADVLVVPSRSEPWGLVVNEAMSAGLAVVLNDCCGCIDDLVVQGETGLVVPTGDAVALRGALDTLARDPLRVVEMRRAAETRIQGWTTEAWAANIVAAWLEVLKGVRQQREG
ncbi:glycosyltransferase family 4 protein [Mameliella alba]|uniref:glycosyltransferase family 4 protein n=1 Tax=Mameliella alba TaxID=561184 RepID=UPI0013FD1464|nr:glycosyltransferase family 4 protein [Mameliella alba]